MSDLRLRLPLSLHAALREEAKREGTSVNQLIVTAAAEKLAALRTQDYLEQRAGRASRAKFEAALSRVPDTAPAEGDSLQSIGPAQ